MSEELLYKPLKKKFKRVRDEDEEVITNPTPMEEIVAPVIEQPVPSEKIDPSACVEQPKYFIGAILMCDAGCTYAVIDTFSNSCVVEPIDNEGCFASEVMSFKAMEEEGWKIIGKQI
jgi:hypothetical protein